MDAVSRRRRQTRPRRCERIQLRRVEIRQRRLRPIAAVRVDVQRDLETVRVVLGGRGVADRRVRVDVRRAPDTFPIGDRAAGRADGLVALEASHGAAVAVIVARHHDDGFLAAREIPELRQRFAIAIHVDDQVREQALLLVALWNRNLVQVDPVGRGTPAEEQIVGADRCLSIALLSGPRRVALTCVDDRTRKVERERRGLAAIAADGRERHGRIGRRGRRRRVQRGDACGAVQQVQVRRAVVLDRLVDDAGPGRRRRIDEQVGIRHRRWLRRQTEQRRELLVGPRGNQIAARVHPVAKHRHLSRGQRDFAEDDDIVGGEHGGRHR